MDNNKSRLSLRPNIKTSSDLKFWHERNHPETYFFNRKTMKLFGDTMRNFGVRKINNGDLYELYRRQPVNGRLQTSHYFDAETVELVRDEDRINGKVTEAKGE